MIHDAIYDPHRADNEEASAQLARSMLGPVGVPEEMLAAIDRLIEVTRHAAMPASEDECLMVDIDLAILGARSERYAQYRAQVRQEYRHVPERDSCGAVSGWWSASWGRARGCFTRSGGGLNWGPRRCATWRPRRRICASSSITENPPARSRKRCRGSVGEGR